MRLISIISCTAALFFSAAAAFAQPNCKLQPSQTLMLYPEGQNSDKGLEGAQGPIVSNGYTADMEVMNDKGNIGKIGDNARIDLYFPKKPNGQMVIVCPGGGYSIVSSWNEGIYVADWMLERGITVCVVKYRLPNYHWEIPLQDVQNAFRYCRAHAAEWGVNQIGVMGFSAGGHLAASATNLYVDNVTRPDFSILIYPVISMDHKITHKGTRNQLIGKDEKWDNKDVTVKEYEAAQKKKAELVERYTMDMQVTENTPVTFIAHCTDDKTVQIENTVRYYRELVAHKVPAEVHIYPTGGHGWGFSSEKFKGKGNDKFAYAREEFYSSLERWLEGLKK